jgi:cytochrome c5
MAAPQTEPHMEEHSSFIKTPKQLVTIVVLAFVVPIMIIVMLAKLVTTGGKYDAKHPAMSEEAIAQRIKPVGQVRLGDVADTAAAAPAAGAPAPAGDKPAAATPASGKSIYETACVACHGTGVAGAPKAGDKAAWAPRIAQGTETLYATAIKGKGAMPPKGGTQVSDDEMKAAVDYLVGLAK